MKRISNHYRQFDGLIDDAKPCHHRKPGVFVRLPIGVDSVRIVVVRQTRKRPEVAIPDTDDRIVR